MAIDSSDGFSSGTPLSSDGPTARNPMRLPADGALSLLAGKFSSEQLYRLLVEATNTGYLVADAYGQVIDANGAYIHLSGHGTLTEILGRSSLEWTAERDRERYGIALALGHNCGQLRNLEIEFLHADGKTVPVEINGTVIHTDLGPRFLSLCHDITGRTQTRCELQTARQELESRVEHRTAELARANEQVRVQARQQKAVAELSRQALAGMAIEGLLREAVDTVIGILDIDRCGVLEHADPATEQLILRAGAGWTTDLIGQAVSTTDPKMISGYTLLTENPVVFEDVASEKRFGFPPILHRSGVASGVAVRIGGTPQPFGVLSVHSLRPRRFSSDDVLFLRSVANILAAAVERHRSEETVRLAQQSAVHANNAKIEFLSRMSHELRTPLNAILGFSQLLEIERLSGGQRESVEQITRAGRHLLELVNEVLDISRIDSGNLTLTPEPVLVSDLLCEVLDLIRPLADERHVKLVAGDGCHLTSQHILADRQRLRQVLLNLLSNAVKYNRPKGEVTLDAAPSPDGQRFRLSVRDTGVGIAPENLDRLFTPFERLGAENTDVEGSGVGLALSKRLVETQHGELGVDSTLGQGSTFWVDMPVAATPTTDSLEGIFGSLFEEEESEVDDKTTVFCVEPLAPPPRHVVLQIEDNEPNRRLIEMLLAQRPALQLMTATRGQEGLALAREHHPELILLDLHLPDTNGETILHDLRADEATRHTPVVVVSADATAVRRNRESQGGADNYLTKPFNVVQFFQIIDGYFAREVA